MKSFPKLLALVLIGLFVSFSFNAYACLVPIYSGMNVSQGSDCTTPGEEPVSQFCDGFKSLAVQSSADVPSGGLSYLILNENVPSLSPILVPNHHGLLLPEKKHLPPPEDILTLISVFRI